MDCEPCGRHRPSAQVVAQWSPAGAVVMACGRCRRHTIRRADLARVSRVAGMRRSPRAGG